jgi:hypothetical protein
MNFVSLKERIAISDIFTPQERDFLLDAINASTPQPGTLAHDPGNYMGRIESIWAYLSLDEGGEGVCAFPFGKTTLPMIAADKHRLDQLKPAARAIAHTFNKPVRLAKFTKREDVEIFQP